MLTKQYDLSPNDPVTTAAYGILSKLLRQTGQLLDSLSPLSECNRDVLHRLRISSRRSIAALSLFEEFLPPRQLKRISNYLNKIRRISGKARDLDVLILQQVKLNSPDKALLNRLQKKRAKAQKPVFRLQKTLCRKKKFRRQRKKLIGTLTRKEPSGQVAFSVWAKEMLGIQSKAFFEKPAADHSDLKELHRFRISAKHFRYALELLESGFPEGTFAEITQEIAKVQDLLGKVNDHAVAISRISKLWVSGKFQYFHLLHREVEELEAARQQFRQWWTPEVAQSLYEKLEAHAGSPRSDISRHDS